MRLNNSLKMSFPGEDRKEPGFGIYFHWPFCKSKCPYCDFNSHVREAVDQSRWATALVQELDTIAARQDRQTVTSVFIGGGTPSLMEPETVARLLARVGELFPLTDDLEVTLEANPTSVEAARLAEFKSAGVNRLSVGVQSFDDEALRFLGRTHSAAEASRAIDHARSVFARISFDLIYGRAGQTPASWDQELRRAFSFEPTHLSLYQLTIEPGTLFHRMRASGKLDEIDDDDALDLLLATREVCSANGLTPYEVSNFAWPGAACRHNLTYWRYGPYLGVGPGAHGRLIAGGQRVATQTERLPEQWNHLNPRMRTSPIPSVIK